MFFIVYIKPPVIGSDKFLPEKHNKFFSCADPTVIELNIKSNKNR
jgi:hypothetical protein